MPVFVPCDPQLVFKKTDPSDPRLGNLSQQNAKTAAAAIVGYPDDEGIQLNGGRLGANQGPDAIRKVFYKMTLPLGQNSPVSLSDLGNLSVNLPLAQRHGEAQKNMSSALMSFQKVISLGGGHDYGFPDAMAFHEHYQNQTHVILNFDAHLDVRPVENEVYHSGTPFFRLLTNKKSEHLNFFEVGIQDHCNSQAHFEWAQGKSQGIHRARFSKIDWDQLRKQLAPFHGAPLFVSFDIDCLRSSEAPGCSQSWPTGLKLSECLQFFTELHSRFQWRSLGIYEVSPPLDHDNLTAKAASLLMFNFLFES